MDGADDPRLMVLFEADGYQAHISRTIRYDEGVVTLDVSLQRTETLEVTVVDAVGRPAPGALIGLVTPGTHIVLGADGLTQPENEGFRAIHQADAEGRVKLQKDLTIERIVAVGNRGTLGLSETSWARLQSDAVLPLVPWGRIRGRVLGNPDALKGRVIIVNNRQERRVGFDLFLMTQTDAEGNFEFLQVPSGPIRVVECIGEHLLESRSKVISVSPDETREVTLGGRTRVTGHLTPPAGFQPERDGLWHVLLLGTGESESISGTNPGDSASLGPKQSARMLPAIVDVAGGFAVDAVEPGTYEVNAKWIRRPPAGQFPIETPGLLEPVAPIRVTVPENSGPIDLGEIRLKANTNAPAAKQ